MLLRHTVALPLTFWSLLQGRLQSLLTSQRSRVQTLLTPVLASADNPQAGAARVNELRTKLDEALRRLDSLHLLALSLKLQLDNCRQAIGATAAASRIEFLGNLLGDYAPLVSEAPNREAASQALQLLSVAYASASKPGGGEWAITERARLLATPVHLPIFAQEDAASYEGLVQSWSNDRDRMAAELEALQATTLLSLEVTADTAALLTALGIALEPVEVEPASAVEPAAVTPA